jgi:hypothetical protein
MIGTVLLLIVLFVVIMIVLRNRYIEVDSATNCPRDKAKTYPSTLLIIDRTDPMTPSQKLYLMGYVAELKRSFILFEKVAIYPIDRTSGGSPMPLFERCNPGSPEEANVLFENPAQITEKFETDFSRPFSLTIEQSVAQATAEISPIIETIQAVMSNHALDDRIKSKRLILVSDMLQNVPDYSHYRQGWSYNTFSRSAYAQRARCDLLGVRVTIVYLWRPSLSPEQVDAHLLFWEKFIQEQGGILDRVFKVR